MNDEIREKVITIMTNYESERSKLWKRFAKSRGHSTFRIYSQILLLEEQYKETILKLAQLSINNQMI